MTDRGVISYPPHGHYCNPGVVYRDVPTENLFGLEPGARYADVPTQSSHPAGTVWACDCGKTWVSLPPRWRNAPGDVSWRRERRGEQRKRLRNEKDAP